MNDKINFLVRIGHFLTLKTYHNNLLTSGGATYLTVVSFIMILAALSEGFAWGFLGSTFTPEQPMIGWIGLGAFVFLLMWFFDRSLASADLLKDEHSKTLNGEKKEVSSFKKNWKNYLPFIVRLGVVCCSLYITAPFLTQLVFKADIENKMSEQYKNNVILARDQGLKSRDSKISGLEKLVNETNAKLQQEIGGKSGTGYGHGYVAQSIERQLATIQSDLKMIRAERETFLNKFDHAIDRGNEEELKKYGITITRDSPIFREQAISEFKSQPAFKNTEQAVHTFLAILGIILISAKWMQPRTLQMYFSSRLQEKWTLYALGAFDKYLPEEERSTLLVQTNQAIPEEFEDIIIHYVKDQKERKIQEISLLKEQERMHREYEQQLLADEQRKRDAQYIELEKKIEHENMLKLSEQKHLERLAKEKAELELREKKRFFYDTQILKALDDIEEAETSYLTSFSSKIQGLENIEETLITELHDAERTFKSHTDNIEARNKRIEVAESDLDSMKKIANELQYPDENHTIETLRSFTTAENAVVTQKNYIKNMKGSLLTFETDQKYFHENMKRIRTQLDTTREQLIELKEPLNIISSARTKIEARKMNLLGDEGLVDTPYENYNEQEIPMLVDKLKKQLSTQTPTYMN